MSINRLSQLDVTKAKGGMHSDGVGLYLQVMRTQAGHAAMVTKPPNVKGEATTTDVQREGHRFEGLWR